MHKRKPLFNLKSFPFSADNLTYFYSGRNALCHAMKILRLSSDNEIIVPSYNCGAEIDPMVKWGVKVKLFRVDSKLKIDVEDLCKKVNPNTKAILVTHFFGFPQPVDQIRTICDKNGLYLIEDCAHAFFSIYKDKPLGSFGDISIFSLRKMLPVPDGGLLVINNSKLKQSEKLMWPPLMYELNNLANQLLFGIKSRALLLVSKSISDLFQKTKLNTDGSSIVASKLSSSLYDYHLDLGKVNWTISRLSTLLLKNIAKSGDIEHMIKKRRCNFNFFLQEFKSLTTVVPIFDQLPIGVCPSLFPFLIIERDRIHELLLKKGIFTFKTWPSFYPNLPWDLFPDTVFLKKHILSFPIHHRINEKDLLQVVKALKNCLKGNHKFP